MALYNNGFPVTYPQYYPQIQQNTPVPPQNQQSSGIIWIQGEQAAKSYLVAPNTTVALFDSENMTVYLKSADASGMPSMKILDYTIRDASKSEVNVANYATNGDIERLNGDIEKLRTRLDKLTKRIREDEDDE